LERSFDVRRLWMKSDVTVTGAVNATDKAGINSWVVSTVVAYRF